MKAVTTVANTSRIKSSLSFPETSADLSIYNRNYSTVIKEHYGCIDF